MRRKGAGGKAPRDAPWPYQSSVTLDDSLTLDRMTDRAAAQFTDGRCASRDEIVARRRQMRGSRAGYEIRGLRSVYT